MSEIYELRIIDRNRFGWLMYGAKVTGFHTALNLVIPVKGRLFMSCSL